MNKLLCSLFILSLMLSSAFCVEYVKKNYSGTQYVFGYDETNAAGLNNTLNDDVSSLSTVGAFVSRILKVTTGDCRVNLSSKASLNGKSDWSQTFITNMMPQYYLITAKKLSSSTNITTFLSALGISTAPECGAASGGTVPPTCGNGACGAGENCSNCPSDCGACPVASLLNDASMISRLNFDPYDSDEMWLDKKGLFIKNGLYSEAEEAQGSPDALFGGSVRFNEFGWWSAAYMTYNKNHSKPDDPAKTLSMWIYPKEFDEPDQYVLIVYEADFYNNMGDRHFELVIGNDDERAKVEIRIDGESRLTYSTVASELDDRWFNVAVTSNEDTNQMKLYIDGSLKDTATVTEYEAKESVLMKYPLRFGNEGRDNRGTDFRGNIDEFIIFKRMLSDVEIMNLYNEVKSQA